MSIQKRANGKYQVRWRPQGKAGPQFSRTFDRRKDAEAFETELRRRRQLGGLVDLDRGRIVLGEFVETYWRLHAIPNLAPNTRDAYARTWANHLLPRVGGLELR